MVLEVDTKGEEIISNLNLEFYDIVSIEEATQDFNGVCDIAFDKDSGDVRLVSTDSEVGSSDLFREFCNYVLGVMKNNQVI